MRRNSHTYRSASLASPASSLASTALNLGAKHRGSSSSCTKPCTGDLDLERDLDLDRDRDRDRDVVTCARSPTERERDRDRLNVEWTQLTLENTAWATHDRIEQVASKQLSFRMPTPADMEVMDPY